MIWNPMQSLKERSVLLVEETEVPGENHRLPQVTDKMYHMYWEDLACAGFELITLVVLCTDCIGNNKPKYHTITTTTAP
jgi:hypothetical protein